MELKLPKIEVDVERQLADFDNKVNELQDTGTIEGVPVGGGSGSGSVSSVDATGGVETDSGSPITSTGTIRGTEKVNTQTGTSYTVVTGDRGLLIVFSNSGSIAVTLPEPDADFPDGWYCDFQNIGTGTVTLTPTSSTIDGDSSLILRPDNGCRVASDGSNYNTVRGIKPLVSYPWQSESPAQTGTHKRFYVDRSGIIVDVRPNVVNGDGITTMQLDILKNGTTIYPSAAKPNVGAGSFVNGGFPPDTKSFTLGDYFQINVLNTGGTVGPLRLIIKFGEV